MNHLRDEQGVQRKLKLKQTGLKTRHNNSCDAARTMRSQWEFRERNWRWPDCNGQVRGVRGHLIREKGSLHSNSRNEGMLGNYACALSSLGSSRLPLIQRVRVQTDSDTCCCYIVSRSLASVWLFAESVTQLITCRK